MAQEKTTSELNTKYQKGEIYSRGKTNTLFTVLGEPDYLIFQHGDTLADNNSEVRGEVPGKGILNCELSALCFEMMKRDDVPNHFVSRISDNETLIYKVDLLPFEVVIRNIAAGSFVETTGIAAGTRLDRPLFEITKKAKPKDIVIADYAPVAAGWITNQQFNDIKEYTERINTLMSKLFTTIGYQLVDFKLEFGLLNGRLVIADEFSFDTCRMIDADGQPIDKRVFFTGENNCEKQLKAIVSIRSQMEGLADMQRNYRKYNETGNESYLK